MRKISDDKVSLVLSSHYLGDFDRDIATRARLALSSVHEVLVSFDIAPRFKDQQAEDQFKLARVIALHKSGKYPLEIARTVDIPAMGVKIILRDAHLKPNRAPVSGYFGRRAHLPRVRAPTTPQQELSTDARAVEGGVRDET